MGTLRDSGGRASDLSLLNAARNGDPDAFVRYYERTGELVVAYLRRRVTDPEVAADIAAEVFAAALRLVVDRNRPLPEDATAWLFGVARNKLNDAYKRGAAETEARRALRMQPLVLEDADLERINELTTEGAVMQLVLDLPADQREAVLARVVGEQSYAELGASLGCSELVARKRVSRALSRLRTRLGESA